MPDSMQVEKMQVEIYESNEALGRAAADDLAEILHAAIAARGQVAVILATGNSQLAFLHALRDTPGVPWNQVTVFHMDEYLGLSAQHPASFRRFHREHLVEAVHPHAFYGIQGDTSDVQAEMVRYAVLLDQYQPVACVLGIGENGHLAFNDPPADFSTREMIHIVTLDQVSRQQQVGEGHFASLDQVPRRAISLTIPALLNPPHVLAVVPERRKARAVKTALEGPVTPDCPASILRTQSHVKLYLDQESASLLRERR